MFRSPLLWRLYAGYVVIIIVFTVIVSVLISRQVTDNDLSDIKQSLAVRSQMLVEISRGKLESLQHAAFQNEIKGLGHRTQSRLTVIDADGKVIADSQTVPDSMNNHSNRPEILQAAQNGIGMASRYSQTLQTQMIYYALPITSNGELIGFARTALPQVAVGEKLSTLRLIVLLSALVAAITALIIGLYLARRFSEPLINMIKAAEAISQGDYNRRITVSQGDEIGLLANAFNRMAKSSAQRMHEITMDHNRLSKIFAGMVEGVIGVDQHQNISHINQAASKLLAISSDDCIDKPIWESIRFPEINEALVKSMKTGKVVKTQMRLSSAINDQVIDIYTAALTNGQKGAIGAVIVLHDISELDHLERIRRDFVANASHELKTPITAIRGLAETILDDADMDSDTLHRFVSRMHAQSIRLSQLVVDLMTISRLESSQYQQQNQPFDLCDVVNRSATNLKIVCLEKQLTLTLNPANEALTINGDLQAISQLVDNLLDNAIKYTPAGGSVTINIDKHDQKARLQVSDTGIGISAKHQKRIFERFYRVDKARSRELGGTGLGLSIVKNIAEQHGGSITLKSQSGIGTTFTVLLPTQS